MASMSGLRGFGRLILRRWRAPAQAEPALRRGFGFGGAAAFGGGGGIARVAPALRRGRSWRRRGGRRPARLAGRWRGFGRRRRRGLRRRRGRPAAPGVMMLTGGVEAEVGNSALVGLPVGIDGGSAATGARRRGCGRRRVPGWRSSAGSAPRRALVHVGRDLVVIGQRPESRAFAGRAMVARPAHRPSARNGRARPRGATPSSGVIALLAVATSPTAASRVIWEAA